MTTLADTQAIARVTDADRDTVRTLPVAPAPAHPLLAPVTVLPVPAPATVAIPAQAARPAATPHELIYEEALAGIAALARNWSDAVRGIVVAEPYRAAA